MLARVHKPKKETMKRFALLAATLAVAGFLAACGLVELGGREEATGGTSTTQVDSPDEPSQALQELAVSEPGSMSGYSRESVEVDSGCKVTSGSWYDPYTDQTFTAPSDIDTDHVVPLANAWRSGASSWTNEERERYANDPDVLLSVEDNANQAKGDKGPEAWKPPHEEAWCSYAERWISIKDKYDLSVNPNEKTELEEMLNTCA